MHPDLSHILIERDALALRIKDLAAEIASTLAGPNDAIPEITLVPILTGSIIFVADLIRHLPVQMQIHLMSVSSYPGTATSSQGVTLRPELSGVPDNLTGRHVLVVDDILDSGATLNAVRAELKKRNPTTLHTAVLLRKKRPEAMNTPVDFVAFDIPDQFVVGYGLDFDDYYRNLPDIGVLHPNVVARAQAQQAGAISS
ncbi:MAG: hypoxanthine phosphoribosyltransferase [Algisphaera sp.]